MRHEPHRALLVAGALFFEALAWAASPSPAEPAPQGELRPEEPLSASLGPGQSRAYRLGLDAGEFVRAELEPKGLPFTLRLSAPDGGTLVEVGNPLGGDEALPLSAVTPSSGSYLFTVRLEASAKREGTYRLRSAAPRPAVPSDAKRIAAERAFADAERLQAESSAEAYRQAVSRATEAAALAHEAGDVRREALARENTMANLWQTSNFHEAEREGLLALELWKSLGDDRGVCDTLCNLGTVAISLGDLQKALALYEQAQPLTRRPGAEGLEGTLLQGIGFIHQALGEDRAALDFYSRALALQTKSDQHQDTATTRDTMGMVLLNMKDYRGALGSMKRALAEREALKDRYGQGISHSHLGWVYDDLGKHQVALEEYRKALDFSRAVGDRFSVAITLDTLGTTLRTLGRKEEALKCHQEALDISRSIGEQDEEQIALTHIGRLQRDLGQLEEARKTLLQALERTESVRSTLVAPDHRVSYLARIRGRYELLIDVLVRLNRRDASHGYDAEALLVSERARARGLLDLLAQAKVSLPKDSTAAQSAALATPRLLDVQGIRRDVLDADTLLLEYALGDERSELWVVGQDGLVLYELPPRAAVEAAARRLYDTWRSSSSDPVEEERLARALGAMLLGPARQKLGNKRLLVSADGALHYLPFGALVLAGHPTTRLLETHEVVAIPSASTLAALRERPAAPRPPDAAVAVFADPVFSARDSRVALGSGPRAVVALPPDLQRSASESGFRTLERLPATRREAEAILALLPASAGWAALDFQANRSEAMDARLARYRIVHFATHGMFNSQHPELSGLVLSLVDASGKPQNGFLGVQDVFNMRLGADLVVLSACQTALGKDIRGEGLVGLTRGFMYAGTPRVVASLWKVSDRATAELMRRFYGALLSEGTPPAAALRKAELELMRVRPFSSPYAWAAFTFQGEWR